MLVCFLDYPIYPAAFLRAWPCQHMRARGKRQTRPSNVYFDQELLQKWVVFYSRGWHSLVSLSNHLAVSADRPNAICILYISRNIMSSKLHTTDAATYAIYVGT